jgi:hypothetical protein
MTIAIKNLIDSLLNKQDDWRIYLLQNWQSIIGALRNRIRLEKIQDTTLIIGVYESHWMQELYLLQRFIISTINKHLGYPRVMQLKFKLVENKNQEASKETILPQRNTLKSNIIMPVILTYEQKKALHSIEDKQLQKMLVLYLTRCRADT